MNCEEFKYYQFDYLSGSLPKEISNRLADHLIDCRDCRKEIAEAKLINEEISSVRKSIAPDSNLWPGIERRIKRSSVKKRASELLNIFDQNGEGGQKIYRSKRGKVLVTAGALSILILGFFIGYFYFNQSKPGFWAVQSIKGSPKVADKNINDIGILSVGEWLETDSDSRARLKVGVIGEVDIDPKSKVRLIETKPDEHRISLERGRIHAAIWAPPKLFFVETPSATAIDLGCMYILEVNDEGSSFLKVTSGWVAFDHNGTESIIPSGALCETRKNIGPGTPYFEDASPQFISALKEYDFEKKSNKNLDIILKSSRQKDLLSLWHLLADDVAADKEKIFNRMNELKKIPEGVTLEGIVNNDKKMLNILWEDLGFGSRILWDEI